MSWQRVKTVCKIEASILLVVSCVLFFHRDFIKAKVPPMLDHLKKLLEESSLDGGGGKIIKPSPVKAVHNATPEQPVLLTLEVLDKNCVTNGMPENEVIAVLGKPNGEVSINKRRLLVFGGGRVDVTDGFVTNLAPAFIADVQAAREKEVRWRVFESQQKAKGLVLYDGTWVTPEEQLQMIARKEQSAAQMRQKAQEQIRNQETWDQISLASTDCDRNGVPVNYSEFIVRGKITVVEFYRQNFPNMSQRLGELAKKDSDIFLRRIDIMEWGSPLAEKYNVRYVPKVLVFDHKGRLVSLPESSFDIVSANIRAAQARDY